MEAKQRVPAPRDRQSSAFAPHGIRHRGCLLRRWPKKAKRWPSQAGNLGNFGLISCPVLATHLDPEALELVIRTNAPLNTYRLSLGDQKEGLWAQR